MNHTVGLTIQEASEPDGQPDVTALQRQLRRAEERLREAQETIDAIRRGDVDAIVIEGRPGPQVYTLDTNDRPYRRLIEQIGEGAMTLTPDGVILYCNTRTADLLRLPLEMVIGRTMGSMIAADDKDGFESFLGQGYGRTKFVVHAGDGAAI